MSVNSLIDPKNAMENWQIGFRELFRIIVPGFAFIILFCPYVSPFLWQLFKSGNIIYSIPNLSTILVFGMFIGFIWFSLQLPKRSFHYKRRVEHLRTLLRSFINNQEVIDKPAYQFLIESIINKSASIRIHYFASMYYMLYDIAVIALISAIINSIAFIISIWSFMLIHNSPSYLNSLIELINKEPLSFCLIILQYIVFLICRTKSIHFIDDIMMFSIFTVEMYKKEATNLINIALESNQLNLYKKQFLNKFKEKSQKSILTKEKLVKKKKEKND